jgi:hypothetical protein
VLLAAVLAADTDPIRSSSQASYNRPLAFVIISFIIVLPWAIANVAGGVAGRNRRRRRTAAAPAMTVPAAVQPLADTSFPDWRHGDDRSLSFAEISVLMRGIADRAWIEQPWLPQVGATKSDWGIFIDRDKFDYIYFELERGGVVFDLRTEITDQLMYWVFRHRA